MSKSRKHRVRPQSKTSAKAWTPAVLGAMPAGMGAIGGMPGMPMGSANFTSSLDAQIAHLERQKEQLNNQLQEAIDRLKQQRAELSRTMSAVAGR